MPPSPPYDLAEHPLFEAFTDPLSGVVSYLLREVVAPVQQSFYYVNPSLTADERWLWMMVAWPPAPLHSLALVSMDPGDPVVRPFPQARFNTAAPLVEADGRVLFGVGPSIYRMDQQGRTARVFTLPDTYVRRRFLGRLATHLSKSGDGRFLLLDGAVGDKWFVGLAELATGEFHLLREFTHNHNHAQFSPCDPASFLIAQDQFWNAATGEFFHHEQRTHLMRTDSDLYACINPDHICGPFFGACHEWWTQDGWVAYIDYKTGAFEYDPSSGKTNHVWKEPLCHAHCSSDRRYWCADESPYSWKERPCKVLFFDRQTGKRAEIQSAMPMPGTGYWEMRSAYHIDPHPQVSPRDSWVVYTATNGGRPTVALSPIA